MTSKKFQVKQTASGEIDNTIYTVETLSPNMSLVSWPDTVLGGVSHQAGSVEYLNDHVNHLFESGKWQEVIKFNVYGISDWAESDGGEFEIFKGKEFANEAEAIAAAKAAYPNRLQGVIVERTE